MIILCRDPRRIITKSLGPRDADVQESLTKTWLAPPLHYEFM
jgi:hypothetical protein